MIAASVQLSSGTGTKLLCCFAASLSFLLIPLIILLVFSLPLSLLFPVFFTLLPSLAFGIRISFYYDMFVLN